MNDQNFKNLPSTNSIFIKFENPGNFFYKICELFLVLFYSVYKDEMFTIEIEDGR